jgi:hypothetical protein
MHRLFALALAAFLAVCPLRSRAQQGDTAPPPPPAPSTVPAAERTAASRPQVPDAIPPRFIDAIRALIADDLQSILIDNPKIPREQLRGTLLANGYKLVNRALHLGIPEDQILTMKQSLKDDIAGIVDVEVSDFFKSNTAGVPAPAGTPPAPLTPPSRLSRFVEVVAEEIRTLKDTLPDDANRPGKLEARSIEMFKNAIKADLTPEEVRFAKNLAGRVDEGRDPVPPKPEEIALDRDFEALLSVLMKKNTELKATTPKPEDRVGPLTDLGKSNILEAVRNRNPGVQLDQPVLSRIEALAQQVAFDALPGTDRKLPRPDVKPASVVDSALREAVLSLGRAVNKALIAARLSPEARRSALLGFVLGRIAQKLKLKSENDLSGEAKSAASAIVDQVVREEPGPVANQTVNPVVPVITVPTPVMTQPAPVPVYIYVRPKHHLFHRP